MDLGISSRVAPLLEQVRDYLDREVMPLEPAYFDEVRTGSPWEITPGQAEILETLKDGARERGLWNFFLTGDKGSVFSSVE